MKKIVSLLIFSFLVMQALKSETEPNDLPAQANVLAFNGSQTGVLSGADLNDWFLLTLPQGGILTLTLHKTGSGNGILYLRDGEQAGFPEITNYYIGYFDAPPEGWTLTYPLLAGSYYIQFNLYSSVVNYTINSSLTASAYLEDTEPDNDLLQALTMSPNGTVSGNLHYYGAGETVDQQDWFKMVVTQAGILQLEIHKKGAGDTWVRFRDGELPGQPQVGNYYMGYSESPPEGWLWSYPVLAGTYYFQVEGGAGLVDYQLMATLTPPAWTEDPEPDNDLTQALTMPPNGTVSGNLHYYGAGETVDQQDWFKMTAPQGGILTLAIHKKGSGDTWIRFRDGELPGQPEVSNHYTGYSDSPVEGWSWSYPVLAGTYYFQVEGGAGIVDYQLVSTLTPPSWAEDTEPDNNPVQALTMPPNGAVSGNVHYYGAGETVDQQDWFKMTIPQGGILSLTIRKKGTGNTWIRFRDGVLPAQPEISNFYTGYDVSPALGWSWSYPVLAGTYYFQVEGGDGVVDYRLESVLKAPLFGEDVEPNDSVSIAQVFPLNDSVGGLLGYYRSGSGVDNWDWYVLNTAEKGQLSFKITKIGANNANVRIRNATSEISGQYLGFGDQIATWSNILPAGVYYLGFEKYAGDVQYKVVSSLLPEPSADFIYHITGQSAAFDNTSDYGASYFWNFNDGVWANTFNAFHEYTQPGNFNVCLTANNAVSSDTFCQLVILPGVTRALPTQGGNTGDVSVQIFGGGLDTSYVVRIMQGSTVVAESYFTGFAGQSSVLARFDLRNKPLGNYELRIEKPGGPSYTVPGGFKIVQGIAADPWVSISGRDRILFNRPTSYTVNYGNNGNVDARLVPVWFVFSNDPGLEVGFPNVNFHSPDTLSDEPASEGIYMLTDSVFGQPFNARVYPLLLPLIPAGSSGSFEIKVKTSGSLKIKAWTEKPWYQSPVNSNKLECVADALSEAPPELNLTEDKVFCTKLFTSIIYDKEMEYYERDLYNNIAAGPKPEFMSLFLRVLRASSKICGVTNPDDRKAISEWATDVILNQFIKNTTPPALISSVADDRNGEQCPIEFEPQNPQSKPLTAVSSLDPNEKTGPAGFGPSNYLAGTRNFPYAIHFENVATATAPAHTITVVDQLDKSTFDLGTFSFGTIYLGDSLIQPPTGLREFVLDKKLNNLGLTARVQGQLDTATGLLSWTFRSLDAVTLEEVEDPDLGILPPNIDAPEGQGSVSFFIRLKNAPQHDEEVLNQAVIVFDANAPIVTNEHLVTFDLLAPESAVEPLPAVTTTSQFQVQWSGNDPGSGIQAYNVYVRMNGGPDSLWLAGTTATSALFTGEGTNVYGFYSTAIDNVGNAEAPPAEPDAETTIVTGTGEAGPALHDLLLFPNPATDRLTIVNRSANAGALLLLQTDGRIAARIQLVGFEQKTLGAAQLPQGLLQWMWSPEGASAVQTGRVLVVKEGER